MSSRQLRRLRKQQELLSESTPPDKDGDDSDIAEDNEPSGNKPRVNAFSAFAALEDDDGDNEVAQDEIERPATPPKKPAESSAPKKSKKKAKKKKGKRTQASPEPEPHTNKIDDEIDDIDRAIKELRFARPSQAQDATGENDALVESSQRLAELLSINFHHLKVIHEMRRLFGKEAIDAARVEEENQASAQQAPRSRRTPRHVDLEAYLRGPTGPSNKGIPEMLLRKNPFVDGRSYWPRAPAGGLTMSTVGNPDGDFVEFRFCHDKSYQQLENYFFNLIHDHDPMQLVAYLRQEPYHVSTLIQVTKVAKQDQNSALSAELCERALFTLGRVTLSSFRKKLEQGKARVDFRRPENRQFWLAGYHYLKTLIMKGTYRTALELSLIHI